MPVMRCRKNGKPGYKYGETGTCYTYTAKNKRSRESAKNKAKKQGQAIEISKKRRGK